MSFTSSLLRLKRRGATLLITVLIIGAVILLVSMGIALRGIGELDMALRTTEAQNVLALAEGCLQESLLRLWHDKSFGAEKTSFPLGDGSCTTEVRAVEGKSNLREVLVQADLKHFTRGVRAVINTGGYRLEMTDWSLL